jgi:protein-arginine kinase activator protein McsA
MKPMVKCSKCARTVEVERWKIVNGEAPKDVLCYVCAANDRRAAESENGLNFGRLDEED